MISGFVRDERGIYAIGFKLVLAVIIAAGILAILAASLGGIQETANETVSNIEEARAIEIQKSSEIIQR
jgi:Flp pilus assembly pilin Flp